MAGRRTTDPTTPRRAAIESSVLAATEALLREGTPYAELNIERIATRAGLSRTAFYFYFRDKRELLMRVTEGVADRLYEEAERWWGGDGDGHEELAAALANITAVWDEHLPLLRAVVEAASADEAVGDFWRDLLGRFIEATRVRIEAEQAAGRAPASLPAAGVAFTLCWGTERALYQYLAHDGLEGPRTALVEALVSVWVRSVYGR